MRPDEYENTCKGPKQCDGLGRESPASLLRRHAKAMHERAVAVDQLADQMGRIIEPGTPAEAVLFEMALRYIGRN